jgi:hypothetical protein
MFVKSKIPVWLGCVVLLIVTLSKQTAPTLAQSKQIGAASAHEVVPSLIVLSAHRARLDGSTLTLAGVAPNVIVFADRPVRSAGHALTTHLLEEWKEGSGSFAKDPPNATVSVFSSATSLASNAVVVLTSPTFDDDTLTFKVRVLEGDLSGADGPASVFIDVINLPNMPLISAQSAIDF